MRTIEQIYSDYHIMPALQRHQLRVAAVAKLVCENFTPSPKRYNRNTADESQVNQGITGLAQKRESMVTGFTKPIDADNVVLACLFHDMGNIIKSDLSYFPEFLEPEGLAYWQKVKDDFINKYGKDEHVATQAIAKETGLPPAAITYLENVGFSNLENTAACDSFEIKICSYADLRVGPYRVLSIDERLAEGRKRYEGRKDSKAFATERFEVVASALHRVEEQIFSLEKINPEDIDDETIVNVIEDLKKVQL